METRKQKTIKQGNYEYNLIESPDRNSKYPIANFRENEGWALKSVTKIIPNSPNK
jgi:hypothetical protein